MIAGIIDAMRSRYSPATRLVWQCIENHANHIEGPGRFWEMTNEGIAEELGFSVNTVGRAIVELERDGIIRCKRQKRRATRFIMTRGYESGCPRHEQPRRQPQHEPEVDEVLTPKNEGSTAEVDSQNCGVNSPEVTPKIVGSTADLTPQNGDPKPELTPQIGESLDSTSKTPLRKDSLHARMRARDTSAEFAEFWQLYPRKVGKLAAAERFAAAVAKGHEPCHIIAALQQQLPAMVAQEWEFRPHPTTWLNGGRFLDEPDSDPPQTDHPRNGARPKFGNSFWESIWNDEVAAAAKADSGGPIPDLPAIGGGS